jgi:hypothetical protein
MDRRQPINRTLLGMFKNPELPIFSADGSAERVEAQKDNYSRGRARMTGATGSGPGSAASRPRAGRPRWRRATS